MIAKKGRFEATHPHTYSRKPKESFLGTVIWGMIMMSIPIIALIFFVERFLMITWRDLSIDEILYHLKTSIRGTNPKMVKDALIRYGVPAILISVIIIVLLTILSNTVVKKRVLIPIILAAELACLFYVKTDLDRRLNLSTYINRNVKGEDNDFIQKHYTDPKDVSITFPKKKRNLVFIFLESLEMTYSDKENGGAFPKNVIPNLTSLARENEDFSGSKDELDGGIALPGATWTMGAMFAYGTGAPLKIPLNGNSMKNRDSFFPNMESIGTILEKEGYTQELLIGSKAVFGGRDVFYKSHGDFRIEDYNAAIEEGRIKEGYKVGWGYEDEKLFKFAKEDLKRMAKEERPFNMTMLTVDTHFEDGTPCRLCKDEFGDQYADVFACSDRQVSEFVRWIQDQDFYKDTTIVLCGDHPTMDRDFCKDVPSDYQRKAYISVINSPAKMDDSVRGRYRNYSTFDMFPTTLAAMGVEIAGNKLGLGVNLYSGKKTLIEQYGLKTCQKEMDMPSKFMEDMSGIKVTEKNLMTVAQKARIFIITDEENKDDDSVNLSLRYVHRYLNPDTVKRMELVVKDKESGVETTYMLKPSFPNKNDPNRYTFDLALPLHGKSLDDYEGTYYIYIDGISHYKIADFENDLERDKK